MISRWIPGGSGCYMLNDNVSCKQRNAQYGSKSSCHAYCLRVRKPSGRVVWQRVATGYLTRECANLEPLREEHPAVEIDLSAMDLNGADLSEAFLGAANLSSADFIGANLFRADLRQTQLFKANFHGANLSQAMLTKALVHKANLSQANLCGAFLSQADLFYVDLSHANLSHANLSEANLTEAILSGANLSGANLSGAILSGANLSGANLSGANLTMANCILTNFAGATLMGCRIFGIACWDVYLDNATQQDLCITPADQPAITVDNLEVAQFIYLMLNNQNIRKVIDTITSKVVLILGRFTIERKAVLDALRDELRKHNYLPVVFDFERPSSQSFTETVTLLARMARFIIADLTLPSSIPQELDAIVPTVIVPVQPLIELGHEPWAMYKDYWPYEWVLPVHRYNSQEELLASIQGTVITPAESKVEELRLKRLTVYGP